MMQPNYESKWWGYIYDQMMEEQSDLVLNHRRFYRANLRDVHGPILECACGTGLFLLPLLAAGHDMYGFDISASMLATLRNKAVAQGIGDIDLRISQQAFESFNYQQQFAAIIIPTNSFSMLATQAAQIRTLQNIAAHLVPNGAFLLDLRLANMHGLVDGSIASEGQWYTWIHPETGRPIRQRLAGSVDFNQQLVVDHCYIEYGEQRESFPISGRWIFKEEFQLLLRLAGFTDWQCFGTPDHEPLEVGPEESQSYWIAHKR